MDGRSEVGRRTVGVVLAVVMAVAGSAAAASPATAQYFGRNKVQYETFDFRVMHTDHFDVHFYPEEEEAVTDASRMGERWYTRLTRVFNHEFNETKPVVLYANHPDFQQTNTTFGSIGEGTGGFTESLKNRVVMPLTGIYAQNDHVLGHELVHAFQYDIAERYAAMGQQGMGGLPLWLIEGMAEYLSVGRDDPHTAMWLRDAALRGDLPTIRQLTTDPRFFPYRYGQGLWAYIGGRWGDRAVTDMYKASLRYGWTGALRRVLRTTEDQLNNDWMESIRALYLPLMQGRERPEEIATRVIPARGDDGEMNIGPSLSPDGRYVAFYSERELFEVGLFLADARTGEVVEKLADSQSDLHFDALSFLSSAGAWSPDGQYMAFTAFAKGDEELAVLRVSDQDVVRRIRVEGVGAVSTPAWSPDGRQIVMSGNRGGVTDLYVVDVESGRVEQLTDDRYADLQPVWSPDGRTIAFVTDRAGTDLDALTYGPLKIGLYDTESRRLRMLELFAGGKHIDPHFSPDGRHLYFISDADGFTDIYRTELSSGTIERITRLATGASGVTNISPALTVAMQTGDLMFSVFSQGNYAIYRMDAAQVEERAEPVFQRFTGVQPAGVLPPVESVNRGVVASYLDDPIRGLPEEEFPVTDYEPKLALDYIGVPRLGVAVDRFGTAIGGAVSGFFSDMLGHRNLGVAVQANGGIKDVGAQVVYQNRRGQWNWGAVGAHIPLQGGWLEIKCGGGELSGECGNRTTPEPPIDTLQFNIFRIFQTQGLGMLELPLSRTRRFEFTGGVTRYGFDLEAQRVFYNANGQEVGNERVDQDPADACNAFGLSTCEFEEALMVGNASAAYVGDWSYFGFTSPVRGGRFRFEATPMVGDLNVVNALGDYRRYFHNYPFTFAVRGLHYGRYGPDAEGSSIFLPELFLGYETLVRGYAFESWSQDECVNPSCPGFGRLTGSKIAVASAELRVPLFGVEEFGLINFPFLPTELSAFFDAGLAWRGEDACEAGTNRGVGCEPVFEWDNPTARTPVTSAGVSARVNLLGFLIMEVYYAVPFQRPNKGGHIGFQLAPGW